MKFKRLPIILILLLTLLVPFLSACNEKITDHVIEVYSSSISQGRVSGDGVYKTGEQISLIATEQNGATFVAWIKNNLKISEEKTYTFTASSSTEGKYTAVFSGTPAFYYQASGFVIEYKHLIESSLANVRITGLTLKLTLLNSNNVQTIYDDSELTIEVTDSYQNSDTLKIESNYFLSKLKTYYLDVQLRYIAETQSGVINKTIVLDFSTLSYYEDDANNTYALTTVSIANSKLQSVVAVAFHPAGVTLPETLLLWN